MVKIDTLVKNRKAVWKMIQNLKEEQSEEMNKLKAMLDKIDKAIMQFLNETGQDSAKTPHGTAFKHTKDSVTVRESPAFKKHLAQMLLFGLQRHRYMNMDGDWQPDIAKQGSGKELLEQDIQRMLESGALDLLTMSANKNACKEFMHSHDGRMPEGVQYTSFVDVKIR